MERHPIFKHHPTRATTAIRLTIAGETTIINKCYELLRPGSPAEVLDPEKRAQLADQLEEAIAHRKAWWAILKAMTN